MEISTRTINIEFEEPFSWSGGDVISSIWETDTGKKRGVYLWTVQLNRGELVYYVGQTGRSFARRMLEHFREHMSGGYHLYEPQNFSRGRKVLLWPGRYGPEREPSIPVFIHHLPDLVSAIVDLARLYRFFVGPLKYKKRIRERIEAGIAEYLYKQPGIVGEFQDQNVVYRPRLDTEEPIQALIHCQG